MYIYLDESGDLGFGLGGSTYLTIAFVCLEDPKYFRRCVKEVKIKYGIPRKKELKGSNTKKEIKQDLLRRVAALDLEIHAITVKKDNVIPKLRADTNILYNYILGVILVPRILAEPIGTTANIQLDRRITSVTSGFKLEEYLKYKVWYEKERHDIDLNITQLDSHRAYAIQGIDIICNSIYKKYQWGDTKLVDLIKDRIKVDEKWFFSG